MKVSWMWIAAFTLALGSLSSTSARSEEESTATSAGPEERVEELSGKLESMTEQLQTLTSDTDKLKKFKFSGYVQARWETSENQTDSVGVSGTTISAPNSERFYIRRGRLKLTYDSSPLSQAVVYLDGGADRTIRLLEAHVTLLDPWTVDHRHALTVGQMNVPFGYEIERSSSMREPPERSRAENVLFPGERDRGIKLVSLWTTRLETTLGIFNGGGVNDPSFPNTDPTKRKDWLARVRVIQGRIDAAVSYYDGRGVVPMVGPDVEFTRTRLGVDAQVYYELPVVGGGSLRGEYYDGKNPNAASPRVATDFLGGYGMWVQNLGTRLQGAARYDTFDPNTHVDHDQFERVSLGADAPIVLYGRENSSGTYVYFKDNVLLGRDFSSRCQTLPGTAAVVNAVAKDPNGIGYGGAAYAKGVREIAVRKDEKSPAVMPTAATVSDGSYPLSRYLYLYTRTKPSGDVKQFVDWVLSKDGQSLIAKVGYFPVR